MRYLTLIPAYGRDYNSKAQVMADWKAGKDFLVQDVTGSGYVSKNDAPKGVTLNVRYKKLTQICVIKT